jgi:hypothetical protein
MYGWLRDRSNLGSNLIMLMLSSETPSSYFTPKQAALICFQNNETEMDGWTYKVEDVGNNKGLVVIRVYDEDNHPLGYF